MQEKELMVFEDRHSMVEAFCEDFIGFLMERDQQVAHVALSGGSTPLAVFDRLAALTRKSLWEGIQLYWGDERCVAPTDAQSNYGQAKKGLLDPLGIAAAQVHRIRGEDDPDGEVLRYSEELSQGIPRENGWPVFDWIWLGMGADGHTASIFPHELELWEADRACVKAVHPESGQIRVSLSGGVINAARRVSILASGEEKAPVLREIFHQEGAYLSYPVNFVKPALLEWYVDRDAGKDL